MRIPVQVDTTRQPCGHLAPPTPDEIDRMLAAIGAAAYASEAVEAAESWIEQRYGYPGDFTAKARAEEMA